VTDAAIARTAVLEVLTDRADSSDSFLFALRDRPEPVLIAAGDSMSFPVLEPWFWAAIVDPAPFVLDGVSCRDEAGDPIASEGSGASGAIDPAVVSFAPLPSSTVSCLFSLVTPPASATIRIISDAPDGGMLFDVEVDGEPVRIGPTAPHRFEAPIDETVTVTLTDPLPDHTLEALGCATEAGREPEPYERDADARSLTFGLFEQREVFCSFVLSRPQAAASIGFVSDPPESVEALDFDIGGDRVRIEQGRHHLVAGPRSDELDIILTDLPPKLVLSRIFCVTTAGAQPSPYEPDLAAGSVTIGLTPAEETVCTYT